MRRDWLSTRFGVDFVAVGMVAVCVAVPLVVFQDIWFVVTGASPALWPYDKALSYLAAGVAAVFSVVNFFVFRPGLPRYVAAILAASFGSYIVQPLLPVRFCKEAAIICIVRTIGLCTLLLLARAYHLDLKAGKVAD